MTQNTNSRIKVSGKFSSIIGVTMKPILIKMIIAERIAEIESLYGILSKISLAHWWEVEGRYKLAR